MRNSKQFMTKAKDLINNKIYILAIIAFILAALFVRYFFTAYNLSCFLTLMSVNGIVMIGMTVLMIAGGIDLGVGSTLALSGVVYTLTAGNFGLLIAIFLSVLIGIIVGLINGVLVNKVNINFFIATLATMAAIRGIALTLVKGKTIWGSVPGFEWLGTKSFNILGFSIEFPFIVFLFLFIITHFILRYTKLGRNIYAIGASKASSYFVGIRVKSVFTIAFVICGMYSAIGGIILSSRISSGSPGIGLEMALIVISATVLGGTSLSGGIGSIPSAVAGLFLITIVENIMNLKAIHPYLTYIIRGVILVSVVTVDVYSRRSQRRI